MKPSPDSLYKWALAEGGNILHVVECVGAWEADRKRLEALEAYFCNCHTRPHHKHCDISDALAAEESET